jgi:hypothetical protein
MKSKFYALVFILLVAAATQKLSAQGCVAVRAMGGMNPLSTSGYTLPKGEWQVGVGYRYFHSFRHFVGRDEKEFRQHTQGGFTADGHEKGNAVNIYSHSVDLNLSYGITDRLQFNVTIPYVNNERSQVLKITTGDNVMIDGKSTAQVLTGQRYSMWAQGLGDVRFSANYWVFDPAKTTKGNLMVGAGVKLNTGRHGTTSDALVLDNNGNIIKQRQTNDQAIQPGDGGVGFSLELQAFRQLYKGVYGFANGYYLFNPRESNGTYKSAPKAGLEGYNVYASPDQYFARAGIMGSVTKMKNITLSLAARWEGIPAYDAFGGQVAYRRPGYVVAVESGVTYRHGRSSVALFIPYNFIRNRIQSAADIADQNLQNSKITDASKKVHVQGDAAFADYSINVNYSYRLGKIF